MTWFGRLKNLFKRIVGGVSEGVDRALEQAEPIVETVSGLMAFVEPIARKVTQATVDQTDDELVEAAAKINRTVQEVLSEPDPVLRKGMILSLVGHGARARLEKAISSGQPIKLGSFNIRVPADLAKLSGDLFDMAAQSAYTLVLKKHPQLA